MRLRHTISGMRAIPLNASSIEISERKRCFIAKAHEMRESERRCARKVMQENPRRVHFDLPRKMHRFSHTLALIVLHESESSSTKSSDGVFPKMVFPKMGEVIGLISSPQCE